MTPDERDIEGHPGFAGEPRARGGKGGHFAAPLLIAVDVGGTTISAGGVTEDGVVLFEEQIAASEAARAGGAMVGIERLVDALRARAAREGLTVRGVGVGVPGPVDTASGCVAEHVPHAPDLAGQPLAARLTTRFGLPVFVDNDVNALALAEWRFGAGRGARSLVVLAPGTGFGTGIVLEGRLLRGAAGFIEFGHTPVKFDGPPCWCGGRGCLAIYASGRGIAESARSRIAGHAGIPLLRAAGGDPQAITAALVFGAASEGDPVAAAVVDEACQALGAMVATIANGLNPEMLVITGGVAASLVPLEKRVLAAAAEYAFPRALATTRVLITPGDKSSSMRGAAALVLYEENRS
jgi:predicted NBD/HSP70 family sugar kinase